MSIKLRVICYLTPVDITSSIKISYNENGIKFDQGALSRCRDIYNWSVWLHRESSGGKVVEIVPGCKENLFVDAREKGTKS